MDSRLKIKGVNVFEEKISFEVTALSITSCMIRTILFGRHNSTSDIDTRIIPASRYKMILSIRQSPLQNLQVFVPSCMLRILLNICCYIVYGQSVSVKVEVNYDFSFTRHGSLFHFQKSQFFDNIFQT